MAASLARRGLNYIRIPTTLIGLIDASIGIKGAVNLPGKKSAIGCFHPPEHVFLDPTFLQTLPRTNIAEGLAEAIKVAIVMDRGLFELIEEYSRNLVERPSDIQTERLTGLVWRSAVHLLDELEPNIYEDKTYRRILDFGHTFSPLIESESGFCLSHGLAVSIDIALTTALACELGLLSGGDRDRILRLLVNAGLPTFNSLLTLELGFRALVATEAHRGGHLNLALPTQIGGAVFLTEKEQVPPQALRRALDFLREASLIVPVSTKLGPAVEPRSIATDLGGQERRFLST
jgi:3-dehydroquinate synthase